MQLSRLAPITGPNPTPASLARYQDRLMAAFVPPAARKGETPEAYQSRYAAALAAAQKLVPPPLLPIYGHGQQLAAKRMDAAEEYWAAIPTPDPVVTRQMRRRAMLKDTKRHDARVRKEAIWARRPRKARVKA